MRPSPTLLALLSHSALSLDITQACVFGDKSFTAGWTFAVIDMPRPDCDIIQDELAARQSLCVSSLRGLLDRIAP